MSSPKRRPYFAGPSTSNTAHIPITINRFLCSRCVVISSLWSQAKSIPSFNFTESKPQSTEGSVLFQMPLMFVGNGTHQSWLAPKYTILWVLGDSIKCDIVIYEICSYRNEMFTLIYATTGNCSFQCRHMSVLIWTTNGYSSIYSTACSS